MWLDALTNYISAVGYPNTTDPKFTNFWPASVHMVGKDILRFHAIYWPAFLLAADLPLPSQIFAHGWWTRDGMKMSKSVGNVVDPVELVEKYGCDQTRYFMINEVSFGSDGDYSDDKMIDCVNALLSNDLGNLAYRTLSFAYKHSGKAIPSPGDFHEDDLDMLAAAQGLLPELRVLFDEFALHKTTKRLNAVVQQANRYIDAQAPWALRKTDTARMATVLWVLLETLRYIGILSQPLIPSLATKLLNQIGAPPSERTFEYLSSEHALVGGVPLPRPIIIIPRYEVEAAAASDAEVEPTAEEVEALVVEIGDVGERVRALKDAGDKEAVGEALALLLSLKERLPQGHALKGGKTMTKKKNQKRSR